MRKRDRYLVVQDAMTQAERSAFLARLSGTNLNGAHVADALDIFHDSDTYVEWVEALWEEMKFHQDNKCLAPSIIAVSVIKGRLPFVDEVADLCGRATAVMKASDPDSPYDTPEYEAYMEEQIAEMERERAHGGKSKCPHCEQYAIVKFTVNPVDPTVCEHCENCGMQQMFGDWYQREPGPAPKGIDEPPYA